MQSDLSPRETWGPDEYGRTEKGQQTFQVTPAHKQVAAFFVVSCLIFAAVIFAATNLGMPYATALVIVSAVFAGFGALVWRTARGTLQT